MWDKRSSVQIIFHLATWYNSARSRFGVRRYTTSDKARNFSIDKAAIPRDTGGSTDPDPDPVIHTMITGSGKGEGSVGKTPELKSTNTSDTMHTADEDLFSLLGGQEPVYAATIKFIEPRGMPSRF